MFKLARDYLAGQINKAILAANEYAMESVGKLSAKLQLKVFDTQILHILEIWKGTLVHMSRNNCAGKNSAQVFEKYLSVKP